MLFEYKRRWWPCSSFRKAVLVPGTAFFSLKKSLTKHLPISTQMVQYLSYPWMNYQSLPQTCRFRPPIRA